VATRPRNPLWTAFAAYLVVSFTGGLAGGGVWAGTMRQLQQTEGIGILPAGAGFGLAVTSAVAAVLVGPIGLYIKAGVLGLSGSFFGGRGDPRRLFSALALTHVPGIVAVPFSLMAARNPALGLLSSLVGVGVAIWRLVLAIIAIREVYRMGTGRAVASALVPVGVFILALIVLFVVMMGPGTDRAAPQGRQGHGRHTLLKATAVGHPRGQDTSKPQWPRDGSQLES